MTSIATSDGPGVDANHDSGPPSKRRRVALACNACRIRKSRCNGERPKCSLCTNLGFDCQYEPTESSTNVIVKKEYVSDVESRLKVVEDLLRRHEDLLHGHLSGCQPAPASLQKASPDERLPSRNGVATRESIQLEVSELQQDQITEDNLTDGMALSFVDETQSAFFGPSSNIAFTRHIRRAMAKSIAQPNRPKFDGGMLDYSRAPSPDNPEEPGASLAKSNVLELPPVSEMEAHIDSFFRNTGILFPFIHEPTFMAAYCKFKASGFTKVRRTYLGLLNIVMAMGCTWLWDAADEASARASRSTRFYERAVALAAKPSVTSASLDTIQYLLLASQYLQGTNKSSQTWTLHGVAVKAAFALGLHSQEASKQFSPLENEIRKRTWFGCILLDRVLSMTFGRPLSIPEDYIRSPPAEPWPDFPSSFSSFPVQQPSMDFFNASVTLHRLIGKTITKLYGQNLGYDTTPYEADSASRILDIEHDLQIWESTLPPSLPIVQSTALPTTGSTYDTVIGRFRNMLTLRFLNLQILVQRRPLCKILDRLAEGSLTDSSISDMENRSVGKCLVSAEQTIKIVHGILTDQNLGWPMLGAWWFSLYYLFNAALVIFGHCMLHNAFRQAYPGVIQRNVEHMTKAVESLRLLDHDNKIVERSTEHIEYLLRIVRLQSQSDPRRAAAVNMVDVPQEQIGAFDQEIGLMNANGGLPDLSEFLNTDMEVAQFFASGIFDVQSDLDGFMAGYG